MNKDAILEKFKALQGKALPALKTFFSSLISKSKDAPEIARNLLSNTSFEPRFERKDFLIASGAILGCVLLIYLLSGFGNSTVKNAHQDALAKQFYSVFVPAPQEEETGTANNSENPFDDFQAGDRATLSTLYYRFQGRWRPLMQEDGRTVYGAFSKDETIPQTQNTSTSGLTSGNKARIAIVLTDTGIDKDVYETALRMLPKAVTLAFSSYTENLAALVKKAHNAGYENWLTMPGEPFKYPFNDAGPNTLLNNTETGVLIGQLEALIDDTPFLVGLLNDRDSTFPKDASKKDILPIFLHGAGLGYLSEMPATHRDPKFVGTMRGMIPSGPIPYILDPDMRPETVQERIRAAETIAQRDGDLIISARISPSVIDQIHNWVLTLPEKNIELTTASNILGNEFMPYNPNYEVFDPES